MPEGKNLYSLGRLYLTVIEMVASSCEEQTAHAGQSRISSAGAGLWLQSDEKRRPVRDLP
jgi:hypothetical protein